MSYGKVCLARTQHVFLSTVRTWNGCRLSDSNNVKGRRIVNHCLLVRKNARRELRNKNKKSGKTVFLLYFFEEKSSKVVLILPPNDDVKV